MIVLEYVLLTILVIISFILFVPFEYRLKGHRYEDYRVTAEFAWLFGNIRFGFVKAEGEAAASHIGVFAFRKRIQPAKKRADSRTENKEEHKKKKKRKNAGDFLNRDLLKRIVEFLGDFIGHIKPRKFELIGKYGFEDPYYTGMICAFVNCIRIPFNSGNIRLQPVFDDEILEGRFLIQGRIVIAFVLAMAVKLLLSKPVRNILFRRRAIAEGK